MALAEPLQVAEGAWAGLFDTDHRDPAVVICELSTGGYDPASEEQNPLLSVTIRGGRKGVPEVELTTSAVTDMRKEDLLRARLELRVEGKSATTVPAFPSAIVDSGKHRTVALRPRFPRSTEQAQLSHVISAMRAGDRVSVKINGRSLKPSFSLEGFERVWNKAVSACALSSDWQ